MTYGNIKPMFNIKDDKLKQHLKKFMENGCILCVHNETCELPLHGQFKFGGPVCPNAEHVSPFGAFKIMWEPNFMSANKKSKKRRRKGK